MEARAINRYIGSSPRKMRLVIDLIRGMRVDKALEVLHFSSTREELKISGKEKSICHRSSRLIAVIF